MNDSTALIEHSAYYRRYVLRYRNFHDASLRTGNHSQNCAKIVPVAAARPALLVANKRPTDRKMCDGYLCRDYCTAQLCRAQLLFARRGVTLISIDLLLVFLKTHKSEQNTLKKVETASVGVAVEV